MTIKAWMAVVGLAVIAIVLSSCASDSSSHHDSGNASAMTCERQTQMQASSCTTTREGDRLFVQCSNGDSYLLNQQESNNGYMADYCAQSDGGNYSHGPNRFQPREERFRQDHNQGPQPDQGWNNGYDGDRGGRH